MKLKYIAFALIGAQLFAACKDSKGSDQPNTDDGSVEVSIETEILTKATVNTEFKSGDAMNIFAKAYNSASSEDKFPAMKAEHDGTGWKLTPSLRLKSGELAFLYAVSPYNSAYTNPAALPVKVSDQIDLLYSGSGVAVNYQNTKAKLKMNHAFALVSFNIVGSSEATLQSLSITGDNVYTSATFDVEKGKFKGTGKDQFTLSTSAQITSSGWSTGFPQMWMIPFSTKESTATLTAVINGKTYMVDFPEIEMKNGTQYIFRMTFSNYGLEFIPSETQTIPLNATTDEIEELENYGDLKFTVTSGEFTLPLINGQGVFGRYSAGGTTGTYRAEETQTVKLNAGAANVVGIETWNSTGFELESLEGVTEIDLSNY